MALVNFKGTTDKHRKRNFNCGWFTQQYDRTGLSLFKESKKQALYCLLIEPTKQSFVKIHGIALLRHALHNFLEPFKEYIIAWVQL